MWHRIVSRYEINSSLQRSFADDKIENILKEIDYEKPTVLYIHGYREKATDESVITIANGILILY